MKATGMGKASALVSRFKFNKKRKLSQAEKEANPEITELTRVKALLVKFDANNTALLNRNEYLETTLKDKDLEYWAEDNTSISYLAYFDIVDLLKFLLFFNLV